MPEGDTIHYAARRIRPIVEGRVPEISHPHPRLRGERWPEKLAGRAVTRVEAHGKHLFVRFEDDLTIHSHLRMTGSWGTYRPGQRWRRGRHRAWLLLRTDAGEVVQFDGPVLELLTASRTRFDRRLAQLGPDILAAELDEPGFLRRLREDDPARPIGDALLDQRTIAGIGNLWKCEGCFAAGIDPWRATGGVSDDEALALVRATRPGMQQLRPRRQAGPPPHDLRPRRPGLPALRGPDPRPRPGRRQPDHVLVRELPDVTARHCSTVARVGSRGRSSR